MARSMALGHCICNPTQHCPCETFTNYDLCPCAGERPDGSIAEIRLTQHVRKPGCASKIDQSDLRRVLDQLPDIDDPNVLVGVAAGDDAGIYQLNGPHNLVQTVDVFSPIVDDPFTFGQISAANSVSDIYAMGGSPVCALSIIGFPIEDLPHEIMVEILKGGIETMREAGVAIIGGHSINDAEIKAGFAVTGLIRGTGSVTIDGARPGDSLVLTKPIGTGLISFAAQIGRASIEAQAAISASMAELNKDAAELMLVHDAHACTDVTGFSLIGHLHQMLKQSHVSAQLDFAKIPLFAEALGCVRADIIPGSIERNRESFSESLRVEGDGSASDLSILFDAQTSGGLLIALPANQAESLVEALRRRGRGAASIIGTILPTDNHRIIVTMGEPTNLIGTYRIPQTVSVDTNLTQQDESPACCAGVDTTQPFHPPVSETPRLETIGSATSTADAFKQFMKLANSPGLIDARSKKHLAIALSISQKCAPCLKMHIESALAQGMKWDEIDEVAWMAVSMCGAPAKMWYEEIKKEPPFSGGQAG